MSAAEAWTVGRLLTWTTEFLKKNGSSSPRLDSEVLLAHARGCERIELYTAFGDEPSDETKAAFREMVKRRSEGTPVAYLVGYKEFYAARFEVNSEVLIPRPETEHLIVEALDRIKELSTLRNHSSALRIADVGTGSGIIAITMAKHCENSQVTAIDVSANALAVARRNAEKHGLTESQITFSVGDLLSGMDSTDTFDLILSNPPYVSEAEYETLDATVKEYEPRQALVSGPLGSELIAQLIDQAKNHLASDGYLIFEFSPMLAAKLDDLVDSFWRTPHITKDLAGHARIVTLQPARQ